MTDRDSDHRVVLWNVVRTSTAATWLHLFEAISGNGPSAMGNHVFAAEAWPDGLLITGSTDGNRWVNWADVSEIGPPAVLVEDSDGVWVEIALTEGDPIGLGSEHLTCDGEEAISEAAGKVEQLRSALAAWWTGAWPPG